VVVCVVADGSTMPPTAIAWLSLDESDNDPTRFLSYSIAALQAVLKVTEGTYTGNVFQVKVADDGVEGVNC
jgi:ATP/maltotriose-dependent transcriptional regulator MalT